MKTIVVCAVLFCTASLAQTQTKNRTASQPTKAEQEVLRLENERNEALLRGDTAATARLLADDFFEITASGKIRTKVQILAESESGEMRFDFRKVDEIKVRVYRNTAVVNARVNRKGRYKGQDFNDQAWYTRVYVRRRGQWQAVVHQVTRIAPS